MFIQIHPNVSGDWGITCSLRNIDETCAGRFLFAIDGTGQTTEVGVNGQDRSRSEKAVFRGLDRRACYTVIGYCKSGGDWCEAARAVTYASKIQPLGQDGAAVPPAASSSGKAGSSWQGG